jgi:hypothetical protein
VDRKVMIVVEGINDMIFLKDFISVHFDYQLKSNIKNNSTIEIELISGNDTIIIQQIFGNSPDENILKNLKQKINSYQPNDVIYIFDADLDYNETKKKIKQTFSLINENIVYLFPNNRDAGDLECLLENIAKKVEILDCWESFENCLVEISTIEVSIPAKKSKIHTYLETLEPNTKLGKQNCKEINRNYKDIEKWNIKDTKSDYINSLLSFLNKYIIKK